MQAESAAGTVRNRNPRSNHHHKETPVMKTTPSLSSAVSVLAVLALLAGFGVSAQTWVGGTGTWDDTTTANWNTGAVPVNGNTVNLTQSTAGNLGIGYTATNLTGTGLALLTIGNSGGGTTTLNIDGTDNLPTQKMTINAGGAINQTGGTVTNSLDDNSLNFVNTGGTYTMSGGTWTQTGNNLGVRGTVNQSGGDFWVNNQALVLVDGSWTISGGTLRTGQDLIVGLPWGVSPPTNPTPTLNISGTGVVNVGRIYSIGGGLTNASSVVNQTAGTVNIVSYMVLGARGTYNLSGGTMNKNIQSMAPDFVFNQTGGTRTGAGDNIGGTYNFSAGNWHPDWTLTVGGTVNWTGGTLAYQNSDAIRDLNLSGSWNMQGTTLTLNRNGDVSAASLTVGTNATFQGYGTVQDQRYGQANGGTIVTSGRVIANGYGVDRTLDMSRWNSGKITNPTENTTNKGWFAIDHGKLTLPNVAVTSGTTAPYNWGEAAADTTIDLVNSARFTFSGHGNGTLTGSLLALDRADVPNFAVAGMSRSDLFSVHDFTSTAGGTATLTIRYDDVAAAGFEDVLQIFHYTGGAWVPLASTVDLTNKWVTATGITSFSLFGVGYAIPEPTSALLLGLAGLALLKRRRSGW